MFIGLFSPFVSAAFFFFKSYPYRGYHESFFVFFHFREYGGENIKLMESVISVTGFAVAPVYQFFACSAFSSRDISKPLSF